MTYAIVFEENKEPEIWHSVKGWPGMRYLGKPKGTYVYFCTSQEWHVRADYNTSPQVSENEVPPEYRTTVLLFS